MFNKVIKKLRFIEKFPRKIARFILNLIIIFDEIFWKIRIFIFILFFKKKSKISKALSDLKNNGIAIIPKVYTEEEISIIKKECINQLDNLPIEKFKYNEDIENLVLKNGVRIEKIKGSIKIKGIHKVNSFFRKIGKNILFNLLTFVYQLTLSKPFLVYNLTHDGSFKHPAVQVPKSNIVNPEEVIAGKPHVDHYIHTLRCSLILDDINEDSGPTIFYNKSMHDKEIKKNHLNLFLENFKFEPDLGGSHFVSEEKLKILEADNKKTLLTGNKGDLILLDLKTVHHASILKRGQRHILWFYY